ncbi:DUF6715 family protein [Defluviitalea raffinosedens]|jgi:hypothetical protein|uniref:Uncharacterized protein n=1 Tax=Defluviitalea raffinosedens TaxID=1450156 RepID=A0A7C8HDN3_9FIRM|nr:DUF6715 family protein [Defluviitalea raffinosedens]KAE9631995.1 hypothetical protein GND95_10785 [Defluviitalea raffinosedens]MBM7686505.1 hypothetical protein [Defluviitalea raffinosedens]MBZ4669669.1 hypothetical protein [Defluviitaleaceae bacterium]HHW66420.1 hypothetical protein [Candidatus Epulonipiscium sp.]
MRVKKFFAIIVLLICVGAYYYGAKEKAVKQEKTTEFDKIIEMSKEANYFNDPDQLMIMNNRIISYLYGGKAEDDQIEQLVSIQRTLLDNELLEINPFEAQLSKIKGKLEEYKENNLKVIQIKQQSAQYDGKNTNIAKVKVIQYMNGGNDHYLEYYLRKQPDETWRILGWEVIDEFEISEELKI